MSIFTTGKAPESADSHQVLQDVVSLPKNSGFDLCIKVSFAAPWTRQRCSSCAKREHLEVPLFLSEDHFANDDIGSFGVWATESSSEPVSWYTAACSSQLCGPCALGACRSHPVSPQAHRHRLVHSSCCFPWLSWSFFWKGLAELPKVCNKDRKRPQSPSKTWPESELLNYLLVLYQMIRVSAPKAWNTTSA